MFGRLLSTVNALPTLVAYLDRDMRYRFANDVHRTWLGMDPEAMIGRTMADLTPAEHREKIVGELRKTLSGEVTEFELELDHFARRVRIPYAPDFDGDE